MVGAAYHKIQAIQSTGVKNPLLNSLLVNMDVINDVHDYFIRILSVKLTVLLESIGIVCQISKVLWLKTLL